jgi:hypothetical protein
MTKEVQELLKGLHEMKEHCLNCHNCSKCKYDELCDSMIKNKNKSVPRWYLPPLEEEE